MRHNPLNPARQNPWEVRSESGLEGVFADEDDARFYADELRGIGARVTVERRKRPPIERAQLGEVRGNPASFTAKGERMYQHIKEQYEAQGEPRAKEIAARTVYAQAAEGVSGLVNSSSRRLNPSQYTARGQRVFKKIHAKLIAEGMDPVIAAMSAEMAMLDLTEQGDEELFTPEGLRETRAFFGEHPPVELNPAAQERDDFPAPKFIVVGKSTRTGAPMFLRDDGGPTKHRSEAGRFSMADANRQIAEASAALPKWTFTMETA
jgi:hypothetical protein